MAHLRINPKHIVVIVFVIAALYLIASTVLYDEPAHLAIEPRQPISNLGQQISPEVSDPLDQDALSILIQKFNLSAEQIQMLRVNAAIATLEERDCTFITASDLLPEQSLRTRVRIRVRCGNQEEYWFDHTEVAN